MKKVPLNPLKNFMKMPDEYSSGDSIGGSREGRSYGASVLAEIHWMENVISTFFF